MGRKKKADIEKEERIRHLKEETLETIWAIVFFLSSVFLLLAAFGKGGVVGIKMYGFFTFLFGIGYYLMPLVLVVLGISFLKEIRNNFATPKIIAAVVLFVSSLAFISLLSTQGGAVGSIIAL
jgi:hypothetical protein